MVNASATAFRKDLFNILERVIKYSEPATITTKDGNAVILSESDYSGLMETLYLSSMPGTREDIIEGMKTPLEECVPEEQVEW